ncbi:MAG: LURP-one-related family protein [Bacteroidota bacterium]
MTRPDTPHPSFLHDYYLIHRKFWKLFGGEFRVFDRTGNLVLFSEQAAFRLREDFRVYPDERQSKELLSIKTEQIMDFAATFKVHDGATGQLIGSLKRKALKSLVRDEWIIFDANGMQIGMVAEANLGLALLTRLIGLLPQSFVITSRNGTTVAEIKQQFNPFILKNRMTILKPQPDIDRRMIVAAGILLAGIERRQG